MNTTNSPARLVFALASCQYPGGLIDRELARRSLDRLSAIGGDDRPAFLVLAGDQIYVDATAGLFDPVALDRSRDGAYEAVGELLLSFKGPGTRLYTMIDDHEIVDNWEPEAENSPTCDENLTLREEAVVAYVKKARQRKGAGHMDHYSNGDPLWYDFADPSGHRFFFADTRTTRTLRNSLTLLQARIMSCEQEDALKSWLKSGPTRCASIIVSPSILLPRRLASAGDATAALHSDAWDGYPASLHALLAWLYEEQLSDVVFVSGDEHLSCAVSVTVTRWGDTRRPVRFHSIHSSALYAPYPFANGDKDLLAGTEEFDFFSADAAGNPVGYTCVTETFFPPPRNGFALIMLEPAAGSLGLRVAFHDCHSSPPSITDWSA